MPTPQKTKKKTPPASRRVQTARRVRQEEEKETAEKARRASRPMTIGRRSQKRDGELFTI